MKKIYSLFAFIAFSTFSFAQVSSVTENVVFANVTGFGSTTISEGFVDVERFIIPGEISLIARKNQSANDPTYYGGNSEQDIRIYAHSASGEGNSFELLVPASQPDISITAVSFIGRPTRTPLMKYSYDGVNFTDMNFNSETRTYSLTTTTGGVRKVVFRNSAQGVTTQFRTDALNITYNKPTASVKDNNIAGLKIYPNPASNVVNISSDLLGAKNVEIFDVLGKQVVKTITEQTVNVASLKAGVYMMKVTQDGKLATRKLVIK